MPRTTVDLDASVLRELKRRARSEGKSLGRVASEILSGALHSDPEQPQPAPLVWSSRSMGALVDLEDKEALRRALDGR